MPRYYGERRFDLDVIKDDEVQSISQHDLLQSCSGAFQGLYGSSTLYLSLISFIMIASVRSRCN